MYEADLVSDAWLSGFYMSVLDCSDCLHPEQCRLCTSQSSEALAVCELPLLRGIVELDVVA